ncbi:MAG: GAF domain-containing protein [Bacteroidia bacterium]|nr:GAF domain-containing protein [Bacteroidia bacterium]
MESIAIPAQASRKEKYEALFPQLAALIAGEKDCIANLSNLTAALKEALGFLWIGFYLVKKSDSAEELVLGPFQGPVACTRIAFGKGVCGAAWKQKQIMLVPDVEKFPGHIACNTAARSEIVVPILKNGAVVAVLDIDSHLPGDFSETDIEWLQKISELVEEIL